MSNRLDDFIEHNREHFDTYEPGNKVWENIERDLAGKSTKKPAVIHMHLKKWIAVAAVLIVTVITAYFFFANDHKSITGTIASTSNEMPAEYAQEVYYFTKLIELKHLELKKIEKEQPGLYRQFSEDITKLDSNYQALKKALPDNPNQEMLLEAMIGNLKWQIDLLNQQLAIIKKIKQSKKTSDEKTSQST
ncbi:MAG TPA: hypothetical protein VEZ17_17505 [Chitinophagaceae bacterium]|nr:hypothetical protein [Chitinophagaceae bacterium]